MGVTAIKGIDNKANGMAWIRNMERNVSKDCYPHSSIAFDMWIPWCTSHDDYHNRHYIMIQVSIGSSKVTHYIWQNEEHGVDRVRYNTTDNWMPGAPEVPGASHVDGDRVVEINANGGLLFQEIAP